MANPLTTVDRHRQRNFTELSAFPTHFPDGGMERAIPRRVMSVANSSEAFQRRPPFLPPSVPPSARRGLKGQGSQLRRSRRRQERPFPPHKSRARAAGAAQCAKFSPSLAPCLALPLARPLSISASPSPSPSPSSHKVWQHSSARQLFCRRLSGLRRRQAVCNRCAADVRGSGRKSRQGESEKAARRRHGDNFQQVGL